MLVRADYHRDNESDAGTIHLCDFKSATVFRSVQFPQPIDVNSVDIDFHDGVLRVTASKAGAETAQARPKRATARKSPAKKKRAS